MQLEAAPAPCCLEAVESPVCHCGAKALPPQGLKYVASPGALASDTETALLLTVPFGTRQAWSLPAVFGIDVTPAQNQDAKSFIASFREQSE